MKNNTLINEIEIKFPEYKESSYYLESNKDWIYGYLNGFSEFYRGEIENESDLSKKITDFINDLYENNLLEGEEINAVGTEIMEQLHGSEQFKKYALKNFKGKALVDLGPV